MRILQKTRWIFLLSALLLGLGVPETSAQSDGRFAAGLVAGINAAQIDGDTYAGYRKLGFQAGLQGMVLLGERFALSTEILLSQRGAQPSRKEKLEDFDNYINIRLTYIEIPILLNLNVGRAAGAALPYRIFAGVSIGRLIGSRIREIGESVRFYPYLNMNAIKDDFAVFDTSLILGLQRQLSRHTGLFLKHTLTLQELYTPMGENDIFNELEPFHFTVGMSYVFY
ncbi:porin family protein [Flavilitoribacter nigricans]|uniref:Outer membrane protein beta-barrel domain-containing protein n=1 Tax=Flavilitoribacter nigricans (strain ATCC 23147 / DSM 23189 / NBRC 102662 / NCIMB 1420 / SS-2) TaxID=1122177 RepID=A0A2D0N184_FLAN2|nr:porin family protein [Flavilitoribacter nigricans]PHN02126.1 hypothetical protein CRP01_33595 [Flavilitoribacter nigricans DSM 23189 = NBRC 102662]